MGAMQGATTGEKRVDRRILRSRKAIVEAYERLLIDRDPSKITVSAIAREANIDRKTFYVHFGTIEGLLDAVAEDITASIVGEVEGRLSGKRAEEAPGEALNSFFAALNEAISANLVLNRRFVECTSTETIVRRFRKPFARILRERGHRPLGMRDDMLEYYLTFLFGGIISIYRYWMLSDGDAPIEEVTRVANALTQEGLSAFNPSLGAEG